MNSILSNLSDLISVPVSRLREEKIKEVLLFSLLCVAINIIGGVDISARKFLYLDMLGTALAGIALGPWWGASVGLVTNIILYFMLPDKPSLFIFALVNIYGGLYWGYLTNLKLLRPLESLVCIQKIFSWNGLKEAVWFVLVSGGIALSLPTIYILGSVLHYFDDNLPLERFLYYISGNVTDKLLCVVIAVVIIVCFFPALSTHLVSKKSQVSYGTSVRSIVWFCGLYTLPFCFYMYIYPQHWIFWSIPFILAFMAFFKSSKESIMVEFKRIEFPPIAFGAALWLMIISVIVFLQFFYFAYINVGNAYSEFHNNGLIDIKGILSEATSLFLLILLIAVVFSVLIQAVIQRESREVVKRVEHARDKIATDIHNDPLQLLSVLRRKVSTMENHLDKLRGFLTEVKTTDIDVEEIEKAEKALNLLNKAFTNYYAAYIPEVDTGIRKIIKPLSQKDSLDIEKIGLIQKLVDLINEFKEKNPTIKVKQKLNLKEEELPNDRSDKTLWKIEAVKIFREVLNNAEKHSKANNIYIDMKASKVKNKKKLFISVSDDGVGFNPKLGTIKQDSFGLYEINTRANDIGATINIEYLFREKPKNKGTVVLLEIPYDY